MYCCIRTCGARSGKNKLSFHRFPQKNEFRRQRWIEAAGRGAEIDYDYAVVCSRHFVGGRPARAMDCDAANWVPTLVLDTRVSDGELSRRHSGGTSIGRKASSIQEIGEDVFDVRCIVRECGMTRPENPSRLFFPVPPDQDERRKWMVQIGVPSTVSLDKGTAVCDLHFELSKDVLNYDDVITKGRAAVLKEFVMPTCNIPVVFGHNVVRFSNEFVENTAAVSEIVPKSEPSEEKEEKAGGDYDDDDDDDGSSLLQEMVPRGVASKANEAPGLVLEDPRHIERTPDQEFLRLCRSCLSKDNTLVSVFEDGLDDVFFQFTTIAIDENEGISTLICDECKSRLLELQFFRESCVNNTQILIHRYQNYYGGEPPAADNALINMMCDYSSDFVNDSESNGLQQEVSVDDPEDLLIPQKEEMETDLWEPEEKRPKPKQVISQSVIKPAVVGEPAVPAKRQPVVKKRYTCRFCRKEYSSKAGIEMHMVTHEGHNIEDFTVKCGQCNMMRRASDAHRCYADNLYCHICAARFRSWSYLKLHLAKMHKIKTKRRELMLKLTKSDRIGCKNDLLKRPPRLPPSAPTPKDDKFSSNSDSEGSHIESPLYKCGFCRAFFKNPASYEKHLRTHSAVHLTQCNECGENFSNFRELQKHHDEHEADTHELEAAGSLRNKCVNCFEAFNRRQTLLLHRHYVHRDDDVVECSACTKLFSHPRDLAEHECSNCEKITSEENGAFVIVQPESILQGASTAPPEEDNPVPVVMQEENADPLLGLGIEEVIELESDDDDDATQEQESFVCAVCAKVFDKADVLDRHMKLHRMMNAAKASDRI